MIEIIPPNKQHVASIEAIAKRRPIQEVCQDHTLYYMACTILNEYSLVAIEKGEILGFLFSFEASAHNYLWIQQLTLQPGLEGSGIDIKLLRTLENKIKSAWNCPVKSIKVGLNPAWPGKIDFFERMRYKYTRTDEVLGRMIYQKRLRN